ncbi:MAG: TIGR03936 family radical SAM-associated protein [Dehalococcoidales bacterium]|nr:TIGR03936 family radical SAM-associated protein [Dehalococcoidales bacterium]
MQRLRIRFCRGQEVKFISHLDIIRLWQRAFHRAGISLAYSKGFSPHPKISLAAPLPIGVTSQAELMDIICTRWVSPHFLTAAVSQQLPPGIKIIQVHQVALNMPSLQSQVSYAEYEVKVETEKDQRDTQSALTSLLSVKHLPWQHQRDTSRRSYDLRPLIDDLWLIDWHQSYCTIGMRLRCDSSGSGRPEQVTAALGFTRHPQSIHRTKLILKTL